MFLTMIQLPKRAGAKNESINFKNDTVSVGDVFVSSWGYEQPM